MARLAGERNVRARTTYRYTHGVSARSVLDYIIMDEDLADLITQVRVLGGTKEYHSVDPILAGGDGARRPQHTATVQGGRSIRRRGG